MEQSKLEAALTEMEERVVQLENTLDYVLQLENSIAVLTYRIQCVMDEARKWDGPDLFNKEGE